MRGRFLFLLLALSLTFHHSAHADDGWNGNINLLLGSKVLDDRDWLAYEQGEIGVLFDFGRSDWPLHIVIDMLNSRGDFTGLAYHPIDGIVYVEEDVVTRELNLGVRHYFKITPTMRPYIGGGLALISLEADWNINSGMVMHDDGRGSGIWLNGGIVWELDAFNIGFDIRASVADVDMALGNYRGGGGHAGLLLGYHW